MNKTLFAGFIVICLMVAMSGCAKKKVATSDDAMAAPAVKESTEAPVGGIIYPKTDTTDREEDMAYGERYEKALPMEIEAPPAKRFDPKHVSASGLKAGYSDDNKQYGYFLDYLKKFNDVPHQPMDVSERIVLAVVDSEKRPVPNAGVVVTAKGKTISAGKTCADGTFLFFPSMSGSDETDYKVVVTVHGKTLSKTIARKGLRHVDFQTDTPRSLSAPIPLDIVFILDTTGSMGEEIARLKETIELININLSSVSPTPDLRFGMVLYKDRGDEYKTKIVPLTADLKQFQTQLNALSAGGGGDEPEDLESALDDTINRMQWNKNGIRMGFIITDAPPNFYSDQPFTYKQAAISAKKQAIKLFSVGTGGLPTQGEYILRQISQFTSAAYIFLTYGEKGESEGGKAGSVSHHTGSNFQTDKLEAIIIRFAKTELGYLSDHPIVDKEDYFQAVSSSDETKDETLKQLFDKAATQLVEYASIEILPKTPTAVLPVVADKAHAANAEYFTEQMMLALAGNTYFNHVARSSEMQSAEDELALGLSGMVDESNAAEVGKFIGANLLITGKLYPEKDTYSIFFKLIRVETAEVLSVTKLVIDKKLGL